MLLRRTLLRELSQNALGVLTVLLAIVLTIQFVRLLGQAAVGSMATDAIVATIGFQLLQTLPLFLSITLFVTVMMAFLRGWRDHEMQVWAACGVSPLQWMRPVLVFAVPVAVLIAVMSFTVSPWASRMAGRFDAQLQSRDDLGTAAPGVFKESHSGSAVYFIERYSGPGGDASRVFMQAEHNGRMGVMVSAGGYQETEKNGDRFLVLEHGQRYEGTASSPDFRVLRFDKYAIRIQTKTVAPPAVDLRGKSSGQLWRSANPVEHAEWHWRMAMPLSALILACLAVPLSSFNTRSGRGWNVLAALLMYFIYLNLLTVGQALLSKGRWPLAWGLWPMHLAAIALLAFMMARQFGWLRRAPRATRAA